MSLDGSGNDLASQQRLLQSYMETLFPTQSGSNTNDGNVNGFDAAAQGQLQLAPPQQVMHPGVPAVFQQNQHRFQHQANDQGTPQQQFQQQMLWPNQQSAAGQPQAQPQRHLFAQNQQQPQPQQQQQQQQQQKLSQAEIQAMFASLGANQAQPVSLPEPPLQQQQSGQSQGQPFHPTPGFNAQLHAAFQQLQQSHNAAPPPSQGFATPQLQHQQSQQGAVAGQLDANVLFKLRQSGMQLTPEQQALLSRAMMRRGALAEGQPGQSQHGQGPIHALNAQQALQNQLYQQSQIPPGLRQTSQLPMASTPLGLSNMQPAHSMQQQQQQKQQQQQVTHHPSQPHQSGSSPAGPIPVNILQEFTGLSEQMRNLTSQEQHLSICLAQNLNIILQKTAPGQHAPAPQPLTQGQRTAIQKQLENTRRMLNSARDTLARLEAEHGGKENIIAHLKNFAQQRQAAQQQLQNHAQTQNQLQGQISSQMQQQQQGLQPPPPQLSGLVNRAQMMTPMQAQTQGQPTPPSANRSLLAAGQNEPRAMQAPLTAADKMHHQAQLERYIAMQKHQKQQGQPPLANMNINETSSPNMAARSLAAPPAGLASPATGTMAMQSQQQQQPPPFQSQGSQNQASQQILRDAGAAAAINEEILKTLSAAGPNAFRKALLDTMMKRGTPISSAPMVDDKIIDLVKLYNVVQQRGGCQHVRLSFKECKP